MTQQTMITVSTVERLLSVALYRDIFFLFRNISWRMFLKVYGDPSTWSSSTIQSLGSINQGLTDSELNTMTFSFDDIARLGAFSGWGDSQVNHLVIYNYNLVGV